MIPALALGLVVGIVLGVVGGGGSIIAVPALVYGVGMTPAQARPTVTRLAAELLGETS